MALVTLPYSFTPGTTIKSAEVNSCLTTIYNDYNGNIDGTNVNAIAEAKITMSGTGHAHSGGAGGAPIQLVTGTNITAASSITIPTDGNHFVVTGNTGITAIATRNAGVLAILRFTGTPTLTYNATSLILQDAKDLVIAAGDIVAFLSEGSGNWRELWRRPATSTPNVGNSITTNLKIIRNAVAPATKLDVTANRLSIEGVVVTSFSVTIDFGAIGAANRLDAGSIGNTTLYYVWAIYNPATGTAAGLGSTSETAPTMPTGYTLKRLLGAFRTDGAASFLDGIQRGDTFLYKVPITVLSGGAATTATAINLTGYVPATSVLSATVSVETVTGAGGQVGLVLSPFSFAGTVTAANPGDLGLTMDYTTDTTNVWKGSLEVPLLNATPTNLYYGISTGSIDLAVAGWKILWP